MAEEVQILSETEIERIGPDSKPEVVVAVTYKTPDLLPRTVIIPKSKYNDRTLREAIKTDIEKARKSRPRTLTL